MPIDYARMQKTHKVHKAALTRAVNSKDPAKVKAACIKAITEWNEIGAWPDDWHRWNIALQDACGWSQDLQDLDTDIRLGRV